MAAAIQAYCAANTMLPVRLLIPYYIDSQPVRQEELLTAISINLTLPYVGEAVVVCEGEDAARHLVSKITDPTKLKIVTVSARPTFRDMIAIADALLTVDFDRQVTFLINTDIVLGRNMDLVARDLWTAAAAKGECAASAKPPKPMVVMSRYEVSVSGSDDVPLAPLAPFTLTMVVGGGSHDLWGWVGRAQLSEHVGNLYMGKFFCDGVFAHQLVTQERCLLKNPCLDAHLLHIHASGLRNYCPMNASDRTPGHRAGVRHCRLADPWNENDIYDDGCWWL